MDDEDTLPLKRVEFSLTKFNEVAIPHHLDLLRQHKANIIKYERAGEWRRARGAASEAARAAGRLRELLTELCALRGRVRPPDRARFDALTQHSRDATLRAVRDYLGSAPQSIGRGAAETAPVAGSAVSTDSVGVVAHAQPGTDLVAGDIQLYVDEQEVNLQEREALLRGCSELQAELLALHHVWEDTQRAALAQREQVSAAETSVAVAADNISAARQYLAVGERLRAGAWGAGGAMLGLVAAGPVGVLVGAKAGALAAAAGSVLGYLGASRLARRRGQPEPDPGADKAE
ncbi:unnamed protein product [Spodoptera littoralis]|uniref:STX17-like N-terminal domain-containing protein n=1 Tax=Spodoptera littoralis TaxID=7109 RepID=A0A9P0I8X3_SPOLI|nr:unnamed protein product [Spodoptera littoralis]CAH1642382.1 unnamed protein product [Spodoptera littoralis]